MTKTYETRGKIKNSMMELFANPSEGADHSLKQGRRKGFKSTGANNGSPIPKRPKQWVQGDAPTITISK